jgi:peptidoglycan-associated lipoprotein
MALAAVSCNKKNIRETPGGKTDMTTDTTANPDLEIQESTDTQGTEGDIRSGEFVSQETIQPIYFTFDKYGLSEENRGTLQKNAEVIKSHREWSVLVEGHCDSRGTVEYNLALGQKRAKEVRDYYVRLGVPEAAIGTISYGEEKPACADEEEACWAQNRRSETKARSK